MAQATEDCRATPAHEATDQPVYRTLFVRQIPEEIWLRLHYLALEKRSRLQPLIVSILQNYLAGQASEQVSDEPS